MYAERLKEYRNTSFVEDSIASIRRNKINPSENKEVFEDYFGQKMNMRRSNEQSLIYDSKRYKFQSGQPSTKVKEILRESLPL
jgi:hypothetical protein